jgi:hypothetical protein
VYVHTVSVISSDLWGPLAGRFVFFFLLPRQREPSGPAQ